MSENSPYSDGIPTPAMDEPARMDPASAFSVGRAISNGISALKRAPGPMFLAGFLMWMLDSGGSSGSNFNSGGNDYNNDYDNDYGRYDDPYSDLVDSVGRPFQAAVTDVFGDIFTPVADLFQVGPEIVAMIAGAMVLIVCVLILTIVFWLCRAFLRPGVIRLHSHILQTADQQNFKIIFSGSDRFVHMLIYDLLSGLIMFAAIVVSALPGGALMGAGIGMETDPMIWGGVALMLLVMLPVMIYVGLGLALGGHAVTLENRAPVDALKRSWFLAKGARLSIFIYSFVMGLVAFAAALAGILMCCVGLLFTMPAARAVADFGLTESFLLLTRGQDVTGYWELWTLKHSGQIA